MSPRPSHGPVRDVLEVDWPWDVVNLGSGREVRLEDALAILVAASGAAVEVTSDPSLFRPADVPRFVGNPDRFCRLTGWIPDTPIETTLGDLLDDWRARLS